MFRKLTSIGLGLVVSLAGAAALAAEVRDHTQTRATPAVYTTDGRDVPVYEVARRRGRRYYNNRYYNYRPPYYDSWYYYPRYRYYYPRDYYYYGSPRYGYYYDGYGSGVQVGPLNVWW